MTNKPSVFVTNLKTFKSNFTGEEKTYRINNALWVFMQRDFELSQSEWSNKYFESEAYYGCVFATCLLRANGIDVEFEDVYTNTGAMEVAELVLRYTAVYSGTDEGNEKEEETEEDSPS